MVIPVHWLVAEKEKVAAIMSSLRTLLSELGLEFDWERLDPASMEEPGHQPGIIDGSGRFG